MDQRRQLEFWDLQHSVISHNASPMPISARPKQWSFSHLHLIGAVVCMLAQQTGWAQSAATPVAVDNALNTGSGVNSTNVPDANTTGGRAQLRGNAGYQNQGSTSGPPRQDSTLQSQQPPSYVPNEFERYVQDLGARLSASKSGEQPLTPVAQVRRFGADLMTDPAWGASMGLDPLPQAPSDYIVKPGDEVAVTIWGSADADLHLTVDRNGRIAIPRVGAVQVGGVRQSELNSVITRQVGQTFRNFQVSASVGRLRSIRVFVTGFALRPGSVNVSALSSVLHVLMKAGGPSAAGSFRDVTLRRGNQVVSRFDLYDLLLHGDRAADEIVQPDDVIHIGPVGDQVGLIGAVNQPAVYELKKGETLGDLLAMGGGFNAVADRSSISIEHLTDKSGVRVEQVNIAQPQGARTPLAAGDVIQVASALASVLPKDKQAKRVHIDGEVSQPGDYVLPPGATLSDALNAAGGLTPKAFLFGTEFTRESVRQVQQQNFDRALRDLETETAKSTASRRVASAEEASSLTASENANNRLLERLRQIRPTGRVVLPLTPDTHSLPDMALEDGDRITIPARGSSVGVFGSVFNTGSFIFADNRTLNDYLKQAGGPTKGADPGSMFVVRANGTVVSAHQLSGTFSDGASDFRGLAALPGDTLFVPEELNKTTGVQDAKDWTQIIYQLGLGLAGIAALGL